MENCIDKVFGTQAINPEGMQLLWDMLPDYGKKQVIYLKNKNGYSEHEAIEEFFYDTDNHDYLKLNSRLSNWMIERVKEDNVEISSVIIDICSNVFLEDKEFYIKVIK